MILKKLHIENYEPFAVPIDLDIDTGVTVLTGQNDVGKSAILRLIDKLCRGESAGEDDVNAYRFPVTDKPWREDPEIKCIATFVMGPNPSQYVALNSGSLLAGDEVDIVVHLANSSTEVSAVRRQGTSIGYDTIQVRTLPSAVVLPSLHKIGSQIDLEQINPLAACRREMSDPV